MCHKGLTDTAAQRKMIVISPAMAEEGGTDVGRVLSPFTKSLCTAVYVSLRLSVRQEVTISEFSRAAEARVRGKKSRERVSSGVESPLNTVPTWFPRR